MSCKEIFLLFHSVLVLGLSIVGLLPEYDHIAGQTTFVVFVVFVVLKPSKEHGALRGQHNKPPPGPRQQILHVVVA